MSVSNKYIHCKTWPPMNYCYKQALFHHPLFLHWISPKKRGILHHFISPSWGPLCNKQLSTAQLWPLTDVKSRIFQVRWLEESLTTTPEDSTTTDGAHSFCHVQNWSISISILRYFNTQSITYIHILFLKGGLPMIRPTQNNCPKL